MIGIITPSHNPAFLDEVYSSLAQQTLLEWRWIILLNGGARVPDSASYRDDRRVVIRDLGITVARVGALKRLTCHAASELGCEIIVELDHDDLLMPTALERVKDTFDAHPAASLVYSNCARVDTDWQPCLFSKTHGWESRPQEAFGRDVMEIITPEPTPHHVSQIYYAPDHLRAWRTSAYEKAGCHDESLQVGDDHDLMCRLYAEGDFVHINELLYIYRIHGDNSWLRYNDQVQQQQFANYVRYLPSLVQRWCDREGLLSVNLWENKEPLLRGDPWAFEENSVGVIWASDCLQLSDNPIRVMEEAYRCLVHGGFFLITVPSTDGRGAYQDPRHRSYWNENSFWYYIKEAYREAIGVQCRYRTMRLRTVPGANSISFVEADLVALKDGLGFHGLLEVG